MATDRIPKAAYDLGALCEDFRVSRSELYQSLLFIPFAIGLFVLITLVRMPKLLAPGNVVEWTMAVGGTLFLAGFLVSGMLMIPRTFAQRHLRVLLFEEGLVYFHRDGVDACRWDEIAWATDGYVFHGNAAIRRFVIHGPSGELVFDESIAPMNDFHRMVEAIYARVSERLLAQAMANLKAGESIDFGSIQVTADGILNDERLLPWSGFESIALHGLDIMIAQVHSRSHWAMVPRWAIANEQMLIELATQLGKQICKRGELAVTS